MIQNNPMKRTLFLICGICWLLFSVGIGLFLLLDSAAQFGWPGFSFFMPVLSAAIGLAQTTGLFFLAGFCFIVGLSLCLHGFSPANPSYKSPDQF